MVKSFKGPFLVRSFILTLVLSAVAALVAMDVMAARSDRVTIAAERHYQDPTLVLTLGKADIVDLDGEVADILIADPSIVRAEVLQSSRLYLVGASIGNTNVIVVDAFGDILRRINVHVRVDEVNLQNLMGEMFPDEQVEVRTVGDQIMVRGMVSTPTKAAQVNEIVSGFLGDEQTSVMNMLEVRGEDQVMLSVRILEVARNLVREFGVRPEFPTLFNQMSANPTLVGAVDDVVGGTPNGAGISGFVGGFAQTAGNLANLNFIPRGLNSDSLFQALHSNFQGSFTVPGGGLSGNPFASFSLFNEDIAPFLLSIDALEDENLVKTLAEPNLTAKSGEEAGFLAGGEFPVPTGRDTNGFVEITFRPFGVSLNFRPLVLSSDRISLELATEVSEVSEEVAVTLAGTGGQPGINVPGRDVRRANTNVELPSGGSLMIAGLIQSETLDGYESLPGAKKLPIIGDLIKSESFRRNETELVIVVTPYLVKPYADENIADEVPEHKDDPLTESFAANIRRTFGEYKIEDLLVETSGYGYLID